MRTMAAAMDNKFSIRLMGSRELLAWLGLHAQQILGVGETEFVAAYRRGEYANVPAAQDLAAVLPFIEARAGDGAEG